MPNPEKHFSFIQANLNPKLLPLPSWASAPEYLAHIQRAKVELHEGFTDLFLAKMGGWHLDQLLGRMDDAVNGRSAQKTMLYSAVGGKISLTGK